MRKREREEGGVGVEKCEGRERERRKRGREKREGRERTEEGTGGGWREEIEGGRDVSPSLPSALTLVSLCMVVDVFEIQKRERLYFDT